MNISPTVVADSSPEQSSAAKPTAVNIPPAISPNSTPYLFNILKSKLDEVEPVVAKLPNCTAPSNNV